METRQVIAALEGALGNNLVWITDLAGLGVRQRDPETLRRLSELDAAWKLAVREMK